MEKNCEICGRLKKTMEYRSNVYAVHRKIVTKETSALKRKKKTDRNESKEKNTKRFFVKATADEVIHGDGWSTHLLVSCLLTGHFVWRYTSLWSGITRFSYVFTFIVSTFLQ